MSTSAGASHIDAAGSLTPQLEGRPTSTPHPHRDLPPKLQEKKGRETIARH